MLLTHRYEAVFTRESRLSKLTNVQVRIINRRNGNRLILLIGEVKGHRRGLRTTERASLERVPVFEKEVGDTCPGENERTNGSSG